MDILQQFQPAKLHEGKSWFVYYYAFNPESNKLDRKRIKVNRVKSISERRKFARHLINTINAKLYSGWNPFIDPEAKKSYSRVSDAVAHFWKIAEKKLSEDVIREETFRDYISYPKNFRRWLDEKKLGDIYVYQIDRQLIYEFLEHIYIERNNSATTRNNYLNFFRVFATFLLDNGYIKHKFTEGISNIRRNKKKRMSISDEDLSRMRNFLRHRNMHYLLACEIEYSMFIRPKELSQIKVGDINFEHGTIVVNETISKNRHTSAVTIPKRVFELLMELKMDKIDKACYIFSKDFKPGMIYKSEKTFRDYWLKVVRKELNFPDTYQFYSLKDTGITEMIHQLGDTLMVRDQARHHSVAITDKYTHGKLVRANKNISKLDY